MKFSLSAAAMAVGAAGLTLLGGCSKPPPPAPPPPPPPPSVVLVPAAEKSASFDAVNRHLELGGEVYGFMDIDGDTERLADMTQGLYRQAAKSAPALQTAKNLDLAKIFRLLGLDDVKALGFSSVRETGGEFRDRAFLYAPNGRHGLFAVTGGPAAPFAGVNLAPADADLYESIEVDVPALADAIKETVEEAAGHDAVAKMETQMDAAGQAVGVSPRELFRHLKGHLTVIAEMQPGKTIVIPAANPVTIPSLALVIGIDGIGPDLKPLLDRAPLLDHRTANQRDYYTPKIALMIPGLRPVIAVDGRTLYISSSEDFLHQCLERPAGQGLGQNAEFSRLLNELGPQGNGLAYVTPRLFKELQRLTDLNPQWDQSTREMMKLMLRSMEAPDRPIMEVWQNLPDGILLNERLNHSLKPQLLGAMIYNPATMGLLIALQQQQMKARMGLGMPPMTGPAVPGVPGASAVSPDEQVMRNLRLLTFVSSAYYKRTGETTATFDDLIGPGKMLPGLRSAEGEDYRSIHFQKGHPIRIRLPDGRVMSFPRRSAAPKPAPTPTPPDQS